MVQRLKFVCGSLVGAVAIHAVLIACGSAGGNGALGGDAGGGGGSIFDALVDALSGTDALASSDGGGSGGGSSSGGGSCSCGGPTKLASEDLAQWVSGAAPQTATITLLTTGPLIVRHLSDAQPLGEGTDPNPAFFVALDGNCTNGVGVGGKIAAGLGLTNQVPIVAGPGNFEVNFPIAAGAALCWDPGVVRRSLAARLGIGRPR
jgi:hypothetical protein